MLLPLGRFPVHWLLSLLQLLRLLLMFLLQLLRLLLMLLLHLLFLRVICLLFIQIQVLQVSCCCWSLSRSCCCFAICLSCCFWYFLSSFALPVFGALPVKGGRWSDGLPYWLEQRCSPSFLDFLRDWLEYMALLPLWPTPCRGH